MGWVWGSARVIKNRDSVKGIRGIPFLTGTTWLCHSQTHVSASGTQKDTKRHKKRTKKSQGTLHPHNSQKQTSSSTPLVAHIRTLQMLYDMVAYWQLSGKLEGAGLELTDEVKSFIGKRNAL